MRSKFTILSAVMFFVFALFLAAPAANAQEGEVTVVDQVIAQVNDDVITLSMLKRESAERVEQLKQSGLSEQKAVEEVKNRQAELIATLVNERLLLQRGKELELASDVEAEVNRRMLEVAKEQGITSIEKLDQAMKESGLDPVLTRQALRNEIMKQAVMQQEVDRKIYFSPTPDELKKYFEAHKDRFLKPESVVISEIYLMFAGKNEADVKAKAQELVTQLRAGADFGSVAATNSERELNGVRVAPQNRGKIGRFETPQLRDDITGAIKNVKVGGITEPVRTPDGYQIFRVDERTPAATSATFNEDQVRQAITAERSPKEREAYLQTLRNDAYVNIAKDYQEAVLPLLKISTEAASDSAKPAAKKKG
ncbi:MAG TPA: peptidyl-prolyl cis-trans isomerase [Pyrinomonadaceae bacterium]|nr:peptidyl-prolyl cis-trans isomerase [Pyrinomonadaceae bacterium]